MHTFVMPQAGQSMEEGTIVKWLMQEGDAVQSGDILLEVETDKAVVEVEAEQPGTLRKILAPEGTTVPVKTPIALVGDPSEDVDAAVAALGDSVPAAGGSTHNTESASQQPAGQSTAASGAAGNAGATAGGGAGGDASKATAVVMPQAGQSMEEGTIETWRVQPGDIIEVGQIICDVETDKAVVEVEATDAGRLARIVVQQGQTVPVKDVIAVLADDDADADAYLSEQGIGGAASQSAQPAAAAQPTRTPPPTQTDQAAQPVQSTQPAQAAGTSPTTDTGRVKASPAARRAAMQKGVDISTVGAGSGPGGRILSTDIAGVPTATSAPAPAAAAQASQPARLEPVQVTGGEAIRRPMSGMRKAIARNLLVSKQTIPHFYMKLTIDAAPLMSVYRAEKEKYPCSLNDFIVAACGRAVHEFPAFRSRIDGDDLVELPTANIGIAVGLENGLVVPVVMAVESMNLRQLAESTKRVVEQARTGKIEGRGQGVFTISNLGMFGIEEFSAIINPPEAAILAVGTAREEVVVRDGAMRAGRMMTMTLSCDHRVVDGMLAAKFLGRLKELLEWPAQLAM